MIQVLVVDDDVAIREMLLSLMEDEGYAAVGVGDGQEALDYLRGADALPQAILLDLMMPRLDGWAFYAAQQADPALAAIPVIVLSARPDGAQQVARLGQVQFLSKPIDLTRLVELLEQVAPA